MLYQQAAADRAVAEAVRKGELKKPKHCQECRLWVKLRGYHKDYANPLDVVWLCTKCFDRRRGV